MKLRGLLCALLICSIELQAQAQGCWPENYGGVMLQGFYWDSFSDTKWTKLEQQAPTRVTAEKARAWAICPSGGSTITEPLEPRPSCAA